MMWKFLRGGATVIPGATFIPQSRVKSFCDLTSFWELKEKKGLCWKKLSDHMWHHEKGLLCALIDFSIFQFQWIKIYQKGQ